jgi:hypothetical protein
LELWLCDLETASVYVSILAEDILLQLYRGKRKLGFEASFAIVDEYKELGGILASWLFLWPTFHRESLITENQLQKFVSISV